MSRKSRVLKALKKHELSQSWYDSDGWGTYRSECCCGESFSSGESDATEDLHYEHLYAKLMKAMKKKKKKRTVTEPAYPFAPYLGTKTRTVYYKNYYKN